MILLPRLSRLAVDRLLNDHATGRDSSNPSEAPDIVYAATGGNRATRSEIEPLHREIRLIAKRCGFEQRDLKQNFALFDALAAEWLAQQPVLATGEGLRDDMWAWMTTLLLRPVVEWRFGGSDNRVSPDRFHGGIRNALQRLWVRGRLLDRGELANDRWELVHALSEDAMVQLTERPAIAADKTLALAVAEAWLRASRQNANAPMERAMRIVIVRVRVQNLVRLFSTLEPQELKETLDSMFAEAEERIRLAQ